MLRNNLAKLMIDRGISATQLFNDTGIARSTISKISNNNTDKISLQTIDKICNYLEVTPEDFFDFWAYEVKIQCGFVNYDSLAEVREKWESISDFSEPAFLLIEFTRGKNTKKILEYKFNYCEEYEPSLPFNNGYLDSIILESPKIETSIFDNMPIQFQNELIEDVRKALLETFDVFPFSTTLIELDLFTLRGVK